MIPTVDDPRLTAPQCGALKPVETVHVNPWFQVKNRGGFFTIEYEYLPVIILLVVERRAVVMVQVYRPIIDDITWELPAGHSKASEPSVDTAAREFLEETGIKVDEPSRFIMEEPLIHSLRNPCFPHIYRVHLRRGEYEKRDEHDHETASVACYEFADVVEKIKSGEIYLGVHIAVLLRYLLKNRKLKLR